MGHNALQLIEWARNEECAIHGRDSRACAAAGELAGIASTTVVGASLGGMAGGARGAAFGALGGFLIGLWLNSLDGPAAA